MLDKLNATLFMIRVNLDEAPRETSGLFCVTTLRRDTAVIQDFSHRWNIPRRTMSLLYDAFMSSGWGHLEDAHPGRSGVFFFLFFVTLVKGYQRQAQPSTN